MTGKGLHLASGSNEVAFAEFQVGEEPFGINIAKVRRILSFSTITVNATPGRHPSALGVFVVEGRTLPLIDLSLLLYGVAEQRDERAVVLVTDFNSCVTGFLVATVTRIFRQTWDHFEPLSRPLASAPVVGTLAVEDRDVMVLDFERILAEVLPAAVDAQVVLARRDGPPPRLEASDRAPARILVCEDSPVIRRQLMQKLDAVGYHELIACETGERALERLVAVAEEVRHTGDPVATRLTAVVSDIEMPGMDGLALCKRIKDDPLLGPLPVVLYSSLINDDMRRRCAEVRADGHAVKPHVDRLIAELDRVVAAVFATSA